MCNWPCVISANLKHQNDIPAISNIIPVKDKHRCTFFVSCGVGDTPFYAPVNTVQTDMLFAQPVVREKGPTTP